MTKTQAVLTQLSNQAAQGNLAAVRILLPIIISAEQSVQENAPTLAIVQESDAAVLRTLAKRFRMQSDSDEEPS